MTKKNDDFLKKLLATFRVEASEHLQAMSSGMIELEKVPGGEHSGEIVEKIYRQAHSLKGAARAVNLGEIESVCHSLETLFAGLKSGRVATSPRLFDLVHQALDALAGLLAAEGKGGSSEPAVAALIRQLDDASRGADLPESTASSGVVRAVPPPDLASGTIRVQTSKLDSVMRQTEELFVPRLAAGQSAIGLRETAAALAAWKKERSRVQPVVRSLERGTPGDRRELAKLLEYLETEKLSLGTIENQVTKLQRSAEHDHRTLSGMVDGLLRDVKEMHMLPFSALLDLFPKLTRELARDSGKQVELLTRGGDIEIDRRILEEMKDPLIHLLRNSLDHGIEKPAQREQKGKPAQGTLTVSVSQKDSGKVEILVADDGAGIDVAKVRASATRLGLISAGEIDQLDEREILALIFRSGFSTSPIITEISGRGLGLAIVQEKVDHLGGSISVESRPDAGTTVRIVLPLTLATLRGILVRAGGRLFIIPAVHAERAARASAGDVRTVENRETISLDGQAVSLVSLREVLGLPVMAGETRADPSPAIVLSLGNDRIAFGVDAVLGEQEVLVKGLARQLARVRNVAGATVLGTGEVVPVLNVSDLMKSAVRTAAPRPVTVPAKGQETPRRSILVVEDSITARALLKNILEAAGYQVTTAVDGADAYATLRSGTFDLLVSDVEMPRMDGFDLTARVRADKKLSELPVVLVTALESREQRERGIDAGANAYIVKSSFDQSNLLEVVRRLI